MRAIHCFWSYPFFCKNKIAPADCELSLLFPDYSFLTLIVSALAWRRNGGKIILYTDSPTRKLLVEAGLESLYDEINTHFDTIDVTEFPAEVFWSSSRFYAYEKETAPFVFLDTDFICWTLINDKINPAAQVIYAHRETVESELFYGSKDHLSKPPNYDFPEDWDWALPALNSSIVYFGCDKTKTLIVNETFRFMKGNLALPRIPLTREVLFAEQRLIPLLAKQHHFTYGTFLDATWNVSEERFKIGDGKVFSWEFWRKSSFEFTHLWIMKSALQQHAYLREPLCLELAATVEAFDSDIAEICKHISHIRDYFHT